MMGGALLCSLAAHSCPPSSPLLVLQVRGGQETGEYDGETRRRENAKHSLERYMHYFERWDAHNKARDKARKDAAQFAAESLERLSDMTKTPTSQLKFIMDAWGQVGHWGQCGTSRRGWEGAGRRQGQAMGHCTAMVAGVLPLCWPPAPLVSMSVCCSHTLQCGLQVLCVRVACCCWQVIECRRILKWTYAYGYYSFDDDDDPNTEQRRHFFEFLQGDAERILDQVMNGTGGWLGARSSWLEGGCLRGAVIWWP